MINVAISYGFGNDNRYHIENIPANIQLALFKYKIYDDNRDLILDTLNNSETKVRVVHLPLDTIVTGTKKICEMIDELFSVTGCENFVVHPNKGIDKFISNIGRLITSKNLCIETFAWRKKKVFRSPLEIIEACKKYGREFNNIWMTIDTSHIEDIWFDHRIMDYLLKFTKVIHLSNRARKLGSHLPFNHTEGELKLVPFVRELKYSYNWKGTIVLEYMPEYHTKLIKNCKYVEQLLE